MERNLRPLQIFQNVTSGKSYSTHRYCLDSDPQPGPIYEREQNFVFKNIGETDRNLKKSVDLRPILSNLRTPLLKFFLDGSRRVYKLDDVQYNKRIYPILLGQIGASCCRRNELGEFSNFRTENRLILAVPSIADPNGGNQKHFFDDLRNKINNESSLKSHPVKLHSIIAYPDLHDHDYSDLAVARLHNEMLDMEKEFVNKLVKEDRVLSLDSMLAKDGSLEYKKISTGTFQDLSRIKSNYRCVVGISKKFDPEKSFDKTGRSNASNIAELPLYHRTPAFQFKSDISGSEVYFSAWYVRIRDIKHTISPFDGVLKLEMLLVDEKMISRGVDSDEINTISANIIWERNPTCYGSDSRWANHIYPIYLTERCLKSHRLSDHVIFNLL